MGEKGNPCRPVGYRGSMSGPVPDQELQHLRDRFPELSITRSDGMLTARDEEGTEIASAASGAVLGCQLEDWQFRQRTGLG